MVCLTATCPFIHLPPRAVVNLRQQTLDAATRNIGSLKREIERVKETDAGRLRQEYQRLVQVMVRRAGLGWAGLGACIAWREGGCWH